MLLILPLRYRALFTLSFMSFRVIHDSSSYYSASFTFYCFIGFFLTAWTVSMVSDDEKTNLLPNGWWFFLVQLNSIDFSFFIPNKWYYGFSFIICDSLDFIHSFICFLLLFSYLFKIRIVFLHFQLLFLSLNYTFLFLKKK